ncbi:MAG: DUF2694 family protein [Nitrospiraceae bacterium]
MAPGTHRLVVAALDAAHRSTHSVCRACLGPYRHSVALSVRAARKCVVLILAEPVAGIGLSESGWAGMDGMSLFCLL